MDQSTLQDGRKTKISEPKHTGNNNGSQEEASKHTFKATQSNTGHISDPSYNDAPEGNLLARNLPHPITSKRLVLVDRSGFAEPRRLAASAVTRDNLRQQQSLLAALTPMTLWESESMKTGVWNSVGAVVVTEVVDAVCRWIVFEEE
ncbi:hypothetical protein EPUS_05089 [Endocarpon pusillum Z07020]|uniref:Uncharacterized protein n=1 Tax=Endocarpon pusillum (strain Z07020 / HMAS-L-300199) TaxID=1263415 RepID=U1G0K2_ENDPU|nr:uncharacterized protein EPUS_05089 [Endocarpon pusillum Z07020]ERF70737.1 hypothetical protein EPUS_05089 [Endocarpon pusillum Z07020]